MENLTVQERLETFFSNIENIALNATVDLNSSSYYTVSGHEKYLQLQEKFPELKKVRQIVTLDVYNSTPFLLGNGVAELFTEKEHNFIYEKIESFYNKGIFIKNPFIQNPDSVQILQHLGTHYYPFHTVINLEDYSQLQEEIEPLAYLSDSLDESISTLDKLISLNYIKFREDILYLDNSR